ncbi:MAG: TonB-dependent receptor [Bacteroidia bacterium]|jgi:outer membrane receptor for ferrienterochelin and colicin|nr:TonB-dependent receptor [Bacteroidia bacterium]
MKSQLVLAFLVLGLVSCMFSQERNFTLSGYIKEKSSKEDLPGAVIYAPVLKISASTNSYGFYSLSLPAGDSVTLYLQYTGYTTRKIQIVLNKNTRMDFELQPVQLDEVDIIANENKKVSEQVQMSAIEIPVDQIKAIPALLGEKDVLKVIQLLPGVQKGSEGNAGIYVRGGGPDQNLIILDDAPIYNANHLFGFFSVFNGDALKSVELIKGGFPARYGGRLSSVIDLQMKDGNKERLHGEGGIGLLSSRLSLEGPIIKNKCSFVISGRRTYIDALIYPFLKANNKFGYYFYDLNGKINYDINPKNRLFIGGYFGRDKFHSRFRSDDYEDKSGLAWGNASYTLRWNHIFGPKLFSNLSIIYSSYDMHIGANQKFSGENFELSYRSGIRDQGLKYDLSYSPNSRHFIRFGLNIIRHRFQPQAIVMKSSLSLENKASNPPAIVLFENALYFEDEISVNDALKVNAGIRLSNMLVDDEFKVNPEPRLAARYLLKNDFSIKASFATMNQFVHLLSNTGAGLPTDLWVPSTKNIKPQNSKQVALGAAKDFSKHGLSLTVEAYYKWMNNILHYKEGASFMSIDNSSDANGVSWQNNVTSGKGNSYGAEVFLQKKTGKFTGWIGYTLSWTWLKFDSLNFGNPFPARYDRRHDISVVVMYKFNDRVSLSGTWVYGTGNAITIPVSTYLVDHHVPGSNVNANPYPISVEDFGEKNGFRMTPYHRMDIGVQFTKKRARYERTWEFSIYNLYSRMNPYYYYTEYDSKQRKNKLMQVSLFPLIPSITWSFKF